MTGTRIVVGLASCGKSAGGDRVFEKFNELIKVSSRHDISLGKTGCMGACYQEVIVEVREDDKNTFYANVTSEGAERIFNEHVINGEIVKDLLFNIEGDLKDSSFFNKQHRLVLKNAGKINPESLEEYNEAGGFKALKRVLESMSPEQVRDEVKNAGLRGRGGAGFSTGLKWDFAAKEISDKKYMVCNADEGDPGAFMDRSILEGDPFSLIEGMSIAAYAIGADQGYVYIRAEYPLAIERLTKAIEKCRKAGYLGNSIAGSSFSFDLSLKIGAGAFVCGEETSLIASIEGRRGMPRLRPPFPAQKGIWGNPTVINNVETLANVPRIISEGWESFASIGTEKSRGTKVFALAGKIRHSGLIEIPMGMSIRSIIYDIGGGIKNDRAFKAVQFGGPSGGCIPESLLDTPVDYDSLRETGAIMGSGGLIVMDESTCMVDVAKFFMSFICDESCGKCTFCRIGTRRLYEILDRITRGEGQEGDLEEMEELSIRIKDASLCGLGQTAPNPVLTTLRYFREEYEEHIRENKCRARVCKALLVYTIDSSACTGCTLCAKNCPANAISGSPKEVHVINQDLCIKCGKCLDLCKFNAITVE